MRVQTSGVVLNGICDIQTELCVARNPAPITAVWELPARRQVNVCKPCLEEQVRAGRWTVESAKIKTRADVAVYDSRGRLQLVVEVRQPLADSGLSWKSWARKIHRNLYAHSGIPASPFFLVIGFPSHYALWRGEIALPGSRPDFEGELGNVLMNYMGEQSIPRSATVPGFQAQRAVEAWLKETVTSDKAPRDRRLEWIYASGLFDKIRNGIVERASMPRSTSSRPV
jgi:hypothetical protein